MDHNDIRHKLSEYLDNAVTDDERTTIEAHLLTCAACADALRELRQTIEHLRSVEEIEPPAWMTAKVMAQVREEAEKKNRWFQWLFYPLAVKLPLQTMALLFLTVSAYYIYTSINPAERYTEPPLEGRSEKEAPKAARREQERRVAEQTPAPSRPFSQKPGYRSLDMKYSYEKPASPEPAAQPPFADGEPKAGPAAPAPGSGAAQPDRRKTEVADRPQKPSYPTEEARSSAPAPSAAAEGLASARERTALRTEEANRQRERSYVEFIRSIEAFPYEAPTEKRRRVMGNLGQLSLGMHEQHVTSLIGRPDYAGASERLGPPYAAEGIYWVYVFTQRQPKFEDPQNDQYLMIFFDNSGKAFRIHPHNLQGAQRKGDPPGAGR